MSVVPLGDFLSSRNTAYHLLHDCISAGMIEASVNEGTTGYFIASKDDTSFLILDPENVTKALSDGFCVCYLDESVNINYPGSFFPDRALEGQTQSLLINDTSTDLILLNHGDQLANSFSRSEQTDTFTEPVKPQSQPSQPTMVLFGEPLISTDSSRIKPLGKDKSFKSERAPRSLECNVCYLSFTGKNKLRRHMQTHEDDKPNACPHCSSKFNHGENLLVHISLMHVTAAQLSAPFPCPLCPVRTSRYAAFRSHVAQHQVDDQLTCDECHLMFQSKSVLEAHRRVEHSGSEQTDGKFLTRYRCHLCHTIIYSLGNLTKHYRTYHPGEMKSTRRTCPVPGVSFVSPVTQRNPVPTGTIPVGSPQFSRDTAGREMRASKLRAKAYLSSLKIRASKSRIASTDSSNLLVGVVHSTELQTPSVLSVPEAQTNQPSRKPNPRVCSECGKRFSKPCLVQRHMVRHALVKPFECLVCHSRFVRKSTARAHTLTHCDAQTYFCPFCSREYTRRRNLVVHLQRTHPDISVEFVDHPQQPQQPIRTGHLPLETNPCETISFSQVIYPYPQTSDQSIPPEVRTEPLLDPLSNINSVVSHPVSYNTLQEPREIIELGPEQPGNTVPNRRPFECSICQKAFSSSRTLSVHLLRHSSVPLPYSCTDCAHRFPNRAQQRYHMRLYHAKNRSKWPTQRRSLEFKSEYSAMEGPMKWNATERRFCRATRSLYGPHICNQCPRRYRNLNHLRAHIRAQHNKNLTAFACAVCSRRFVTATALDRHMWRGHREVAYERRICPVCDLSFANNSSMKRHLVVHSNDKHYRCAWCLKSFKFHSSCMKHMNAQVCRSGLLIPSEHSVVAEVDTSRSMDIIGSMKPDNLPVCPLYSDAFHLPSSSVNQISSSSPFTLNDPNCSWSLCDAAMPTDSMSSHAKVVSIQYPIFQSSADHNLQPFSHQLDLDPVVLPHYEPDALTWSDQGKTPVLIDSLSTNRIFIEQLPSLVPHSNSLVSNVDLNLTSQSTVITMKPTDTHGYSNLLMGSEFSRDAVHTANPINLQPTWSYVTDLTDAQPMSAAATCDQLTRSVELTQLSGKPCKDLVSTSLIGSTLNDDIHNVNEQSELNITQSQKLERPKHGADENPKTVAAETFPPELPLEKDEREHCLKPFFACGLCTASFDDTEALLVHSHTKHPVIEKQYICSVCDTTVASELLLKVHHQLHTESGLHALHCPLCPSAAFASQSGLTRHINCCHPDPNTQRFRCSHCGNRFFQLRQLRTHVNASACMSIEFTTNDNEQTLSSGMNDRPRIQKRRSGHSRILPLRPKDLLQLVQTKPSNDLSLSEKYLIRAATEAVNGREKAQNPIRNATVASTSTCAQANQTVKPHACTVCAHSFRLASDLKRHMCQHTGDRPFKCTMCDKQYLKHSQLRHHCLRVHKNDATQEQNNSNRPRFGCHVCNRSFTDKFSLFRHMRLHASRKRSACPYCHHQFSSTTRKKTHMITCSKAVFFDFPKTDSPYTGNRKPLSFLDQLREIGDSNTTIHTSGETAVDSSLGPATLGTNLVQVVDLDELPTPSGEFSISMDVISRKSMTEQVNESHGQLLQTCGTRREPEVITESSNASQPTWSNSHSHLELLPDSSDQRVSARFVELTRCIACAQEFSDQVSYTRHICPTGTVNPYRQGTDQRSPCTTKTNPRIQVGRKNQPFQALYKCSRCDQLFSQLNILRRHEAIVHDHDRAHVCHICGAKFTKRSSLTSHERIHLNLKPYRCSHCAMEFRQRSNMRRHIKLIHT